MTDDAGHVGWGEAPALKDWGGEFGRYFGESPAIVRLVIEKYLAPAVTGADPGNFVDLHRRMDVVIKGYPYAKCAVELAAYDLAGRRAGLPVHALLGGHVRTRIAVTHSIGLIGIEEAEAETAKVAAEGIKTIKIKVGVDAKRDIEMVRIIRNAVGAGVELCVDANEGYKTPGEAIRIIRKMEQYDLKYAEQPVMGIARMAEVARAIDTPVMADESAWNAHDVIEIIERRAAQIVSIYTTKPGGLYRADGGGGRLPRGGHRLQRQRLRGNRRRQPRQSATRRRGGGGDLVVRRSGLDACRGAARTDRRHLLQGRLDPARHGICRWRD